MERWEHMETLREMGIQCWKAEIRTRRWEHKLRKTDTKRA